MSLVVLLAAVLALALSGPAGGATKFEKQLRQGVNAIRNAEADVIAVSERLGLGEAARQALGDKGQKLETSVEKVRKTLQRMRNARKRPGTAAEAILAELAAKAAKRGAATYKKAVGSPDAGAAIDALVTGGLPALKEEFKDRFEAEWAKQVEKVARKELGSELPARGLDILKAKSVKDAVDVLVDEAKARGLRVAEREIASAFASALPAGNLGALDLEQLQELLRDPAAFAKRVLKRLPSRAKEFILREAISKLGVKTVPQAMLVQFGVETLVRIVKGAIRKKGNVEFRTRKTIASFKNREAELKALKKADGLGTARSVLERARNALQKTRFLKEDLRRQGRTALLQQLLAAEQSLRARIIEIQRKFNMNSKLAQSVFERILKQLARNEKVVCGGIQGVRSPQVCKVPSPPPAATGAWTGTWIQTYGTQGQGNMVLIQTGSSVRGCYERENSTIIGTVTGNVLAGEWHNREGSIDTGPFRWEMQADGSFSGVWSYVPPLGSTPNWAGTLIDRSVDAGEICVLP